MPEKRNPKESSKDRKDSHGDITPHLKYLAKASRETMKRRLKIYRMKEDIMEALPIVCLSVEIGNKFAKWRDFIHPLDPVSLDDLKNWFGVPNEVAKKQLSQTRMLPEGGKILGPLVRVTVRNLPAKRFEFARLEHEQRAAVKQMATNLLYGYVDADEARRPQTAAVVNYMLEQAKSLGTSMFAIPDLIVCPDDKVIFHNIAVLFFNNILIYGDGQITTRGHTSINAQQIRHVNA